MTSKSGATVEQVFGEHGPRLRRAGFAVLPAKGKAPLMRGFSGWEVAPGPQTVDKWAARNPHANVVYVPGLSCAKKGGEGLVVVDGDDQEACGRVIELFGDTPGKVRTRRGKHFLYRDNGTSLGKVQSLQRFGINADIKHGRSIAVAPPSRHEDDQSFAYSWDGCDETAINDLPPFNSQALQKIIQSNPEVLAQSPLCNLNTNVTLTVPAPGGEGVSRSSGDSLDSQS